MSSAAILVEVEIDLGDRHEADRQHDVVNVGDHGAERELPFEPEPEIDQDREDREHQAEHAEGQQFAGYAGADHFDAAILHGIAERAADLLHRLLLRGVATGLLCHPYQHVGWTAELLQLDVAEPQRAQRRAHRADVGRAGFGLHFQQRAAPEIDAEIQPVGEEQHDREDRKRGRDRKADAAKAREIEMRVVRDDAQRRQQIEHGDHGQHGDQNAQPNENELKSQ